ncbi:MAG: hypothetical protein V2A73_02845 [Pseudomonadota bacterium]
MKPGTRNRKPGAENGPRRKGDAGHTPLPTWWIRAAVVGTLLLDSRALADDASGETSETSEIGNTGETAAGSPVALDFVGSLKASLLVPEGAAALNLWRLRVGGSAKLRRPELKLEVAYEQRLRSIPRGTDSSVTVLPPDSAAPYRLRQLDDTLHAVDDTYSHRHELDRALLAWYSNHLDLTAGRQAIGWGRGVLFSAVDVFAPFMPFEIDREWRRGIDALRADLSFWDNYSLDLVGAFGATLDKSLLLGRLRGYLGSFDGELICGKRAQDWMYAATLSASIADAEFHGEIALFDTPDERNDDGSTLRLGTVAKAVAGASYTFDVGNGLTLWIEYHYSGFGSGSIAETLERLANPAFRARFLRGDMQTLGKHAHALRASYQLDDDLVAGFSWISNLSDFSAVVAPSVIWNPSANVTLLGSAYFPYGERAVSSDERQSEYGDTPVTAFVQLAVYY